MNDKPIFIAGAHKSGTSLLRNILDGHSQLFAIPIEAHYFQNMKYWVDNEYRWQRPKPMTTEEIIKSFCKFIGRLNAVHDEWGGSSAVGMFDEAKFAEHFSAIRKGDGDKERIAKYFDAIHFSLKGTGLRETTRVVEKSVENAEFAEELSRLFPNAKFVHILRNPYANMVSLRKYRSVNHGFPIMRRIVRTFRNTFYFMYRNQRTMKSYYVLRYEDLVSDPERQIKALCGFLEIPFEPILMYPTVQGEPWGGNSWTGEVFDGISSANLDKWKTEIHPIEVKYVNALFPFVLRDYRYEVYPPNGSFWRPAKSENIRRYLANRLYRYLLQEWDRCPA